MKRSKLRNCSPAWRLKLSTGLYKEYSFRLILSGVVCLNSRDHTACSVHKWGTHLTLFACLQMIVSYTIVWRRTLPLGLFYASKSYLQLFPDSHSTGNSTQPCSIPSYQQTLANPGQRHEAYVPQLGGYRAFIPEPDKIGLQVYAHDNWTWQQVQ